MIDWRMVVLLLVNNGKTHGEIAKATRVCRQSITAYCNREIQPRFDNCIRLLDYASDILSDDELQRCRNS